MKQILKNMLTFERYYDLNTEVDDLVLKNEVLFKENE